jgi:hypothetical protein
MAISNPANYLTPTTSSFLPVTKPAGTMDPGTATLIGGGISALGSGASAIGGKNAGNQARAAAREQAAAVQAAGRETPIAQFGFDVAGKKFDTMFGGPADRFNLAQDAALQGALAFNPGSSNLINERRQALMRNADMYGMRTPGHGAAFSRFV